MTEINTNSKEYISRINKLMDYLDYHLHEDLNLVKLANIANFSPYHFHRIFTAMMGETLNNFVKRKRLEKAAFLILNDKDAIISDIAINCGFNSASVFSRAFSEHYGITAKQAREIGYENFSKNRQLKSKNCKTDDVEETYFRNVKINQNRSLHMKTKIEVKEMPALNLLYCRHTGRFDKIYLAYEKLMKWAGPRGLLKFPETQTATVYHDDPKVTNPEKVRQSACITYKGEVKVDGEIGKMSVPAGKYAVGRFEIGVMEFEQAWNAMCLWLTESGYQPADGFPYELYYNDHESHPEKKFILDICIPVKSL